MMNKIISYNKFSEINEGYPQAVHDPVFGSDVFRVRYRQVNDLSNKRSSDLIKKPINDLLDTFQVGDVVSGKAIKDGSFYEGKIISIGKDELGENIDIEINVEGELILLAPATVTLVDDIGNSTQGDAPVGDQLDPTTNGDFIPTTFESNKNV